MTVRVFLGILALFTLLSGWMKSRARIRTVMGGSGGLGVVELLAGIALLVSQAPGVASDGTRTSLAWATAGVLVVSNLFSLLKARRVRRVREDSEGVRLYAKIKSREIIGGGAAPEGPPTDSEG